jgi:hypothetical protein
MDKDDVFLPAAQVKRRYGDITDMTLWRWLHDAKLEFPPPADIAGRRYWRLSELQRFEAQCAVRRSERSGQRNNIARAKVK